MTSKFILLLLTCTFVFNVVIIIAFSVFYTRYQKLKRRYNFMSSEFEVLSAAFYLKGKEVTNPISSNGILKNKN